MRREWWRPAPAEALRATRTQGGAIPFACLVAFTLVLLLSPQSTFPALRTLRPALLCAALAIVALLSERFLSRRPLLAARREVWLAFGLVGWAVATTPFSYWPGGSFEVLQNHFLKSVAIFWLISGVVDTEKRLRTMLWVLSLVGLLLGVTAVKNYLSGVFMAGSAVNRIMGFDAPLTANPNDLAMMLTIIMPMAVGLGLGAGRRSVRWVMGVVVGLLVVGVVATFSRAGFITLLALFAIYVTKLLEGPRKSLALVAIIAAMIAVPLLPQKYVGHLGTITDMESDTTGSAQQRWNDTVAATKFIADSPLIGAGIGQHVIALAPYGGSARLVHNVYLEQAADLGLPGLALFLAILSGCWRGLRRAQRDAARVSPRLYRMAEGLEVSLAAFAVCAAFHPVAYHFYFYYLAGLALAAAGIATNTRGARTWAG